MLNNLKAVAFKESITYLKEKTIAVTNMLTNTHRKFVKQFISHKKRTKKMIEELQAWKDKMCRLDPHFVKQAPVLEAQYQLDY